MTPAYTSRVLEEQGLGGGQEPGPKYGSALGSPEVTPYPPTHTPSLSFLELGMGTLNS